MTSTPHGSPIPPVDPPKPTCPTCGGSKLAGLYIGAGSGCICEATSEPPCAECGKQKAGHIELLGHWYCHEFTIDTSGDEAVAEFTPRSPVEADAPTLDSPNSLGPELAALRERGNVRVNDPRVADAPEEATVLSDLREYVAALEALHVMALDDGDTLRARVSQLEAAARALREEWWLAHGEEWHGGSAGLYGDDGELQCNICLIDFAREPVQRIRMLLLARVARRRATPERPEADASDRSRSTPNASGVSTYIAERAARLSAEQERDALRAAAERFEATVEHHRTWGDGSALMWSIAMSQAYSLLRTALASRPEPPA